jgi:hypothetical protein
VAPAQIVEARVPPYEPVFEISINRREDSDVRES